MFGYNVKKTSDMVGINPVINNVQVTSTAVPNGAMIHTIYCGAYAPANGSYEIIINSVPYRQKLNQGINLNIIKKVDNILVQKNETETNIVRCIVTYSTYKDPYEITQDIAMPIVSFGFILFFFFLPFYVALKLPFFITKYKIYKDLKNKKDLGKI